MWTASMYYMLGIELIYFDKGKEDRFQNIIFTCSLEHLKFIRKSFEEP